VTLAVTRVLVENAAHAAGAAAAVNPLVHVEFV